MKKLTSGIFLCNIVSDTGRVYDEDDYEFQYNRSFEARLIQSDNEVKELYNLFKNKILSYKKITQHMAWNHESFNIGRNQIFKFKIKGKSLYLMLKNNPSSHEKFSGEYTENKKYSKTPFMYRINGDRRQIYAMELIELIAKQEGLIVNKKFVEIDYLKDLVFQSTENLISKGLIKDNVKEVTKLEVVTEEVANKAMTNELAEELIQKKSSNVVVSKSQLYPINLGVLESNFESGEVVNVDTLKAKKLVAKNVKGIKILASGKLTKALKVEANLLSLSAAKMIILAGGEAVKIN